LIAAWFVLLCMIKKDDWIAAAYNKVFDNIIKIDRLRIKDAVKKKKLAAYHGIAAAIMGIFWGGNSSRQIMKLEFQNTRIQNGTFKNIGLLDMPGYVLLRLNESINRSSLHKKAYFRCHELYGAKHADKKTQQLLARLISYPILGVATSLFLGALISTTGETTIGTMILVFGTVIVLTLAFYLYDMVRVQIVRRRDAISRQFPNIVSKLALLVSSGMIMDRAWKETAYSQEAEIYLEMRKTAEELDNLLSPEAAYGNFISRCNTKETSKLASAIMQNLSKGNAEIGALLKNMAKEAWQERRRSAKRDAEKANSKLMIPTMLLLIAVLIMLMVPVALNFTGI